MKKLGIIFIIILISGLFLNNINLILAQVTTPQELLQQQTGINPESIPKSPEEIKDIYLKQEWSDVIAKIPVIGQIHNYFLVHPLIFKIIFNEPYTISLVFFLVVILWAYSMAAISDILRTSELVKTGSSVLIGAASTIILAQVKVFNIIATTALNIIFAKEEWWIRGILWVLLFVILAIIVYIERMLGKEFKKIREAKARGKTEEEIAKLKKFTGGVYDAERIIK